MDIPEGTPNDRLPAGTSHVSPADVRGDLYELIPGEDLINPATWAGSVPQIGGIAPRVRIGRSRGVNLLWLLPIGLVLLIASVAVAQGLRNIPSVQQFVAQHPGATQPSPSDTTSGFPAWVRWQHFFNLFLLIFIIRSGIQI